MLFWCYHTLHHSAGFAHSVAIVLPGTPHSGTNVVAAEWVIPGRMQVWMEPWSCLETQPLSCLIRPEHDRLGLGGDLSGLSVDHIL